jgi:hypothetical protein
MKPYEQFIEKMLRATRASQGQSPAAATEIIQQALRSAGLLQPADGAAQDAPAQQFVDLNEAPDWARKWQTPEHGAEAMRDWAARFMPQHPMRERPRHERTADEPGQFLSGSFSAEAGSRNYRLYIQAHPRWWSCCTVASRTLTISPPAPA